MKAPIRILNLGAGVQSTTIAVMAQMNYEAIMRGEEMPYPLVGLIEFAVFGDTGDEPWKVYQHLVWLVQRCHNIRFLVRSIDRRRNRILKKLFPLDGVFKPKRALRILARLRKIDKGTLRGSLMEGVNSTGQRFASIPAYTWDGKTLRMTRAGHQRDEGQVKRQCTAEWKIDAVENTIRREILGIEPRKWIPRGTNIIQIFGLSFDEPSRVRKVAARMKDVYWTTPEFPLHAMEQTRGGCLSWLKKHGPPYKVVRSACNECPLRQNSEWVEMRDNDPESFEEACHTDDNLRRPGAILNRNTDSQMFIHRSCVPLREAKIDAPESKREQESFGFARECEGMCGV